MENIERDGNWRDCKTNEMCFTKRKNDRDKKIAYRWIKAYNKECFDLRKIIYKTQTVK